MQKFRAVLPYCDNTGRRNLPVIQKILQALGDIVFVRDNKFRVTREYFLADLQLCIVLCRVNIVPDTDNCAVLIVKGERQRFLSVPPTAAARR